MLTDTEINELEALLAKAKAEKVARETAATKVKFRRLATFGFNKGRIRVLQGLGGARKDLSMQELHEIYGDSVIVDLQYQVLNKVGEVLVPWTSTNGLDIPNFRDDDVPVDQLPSHMKNATEISWEG